MSAFELYGILLLCVLPFVLIGGCISLFCSLGKLYRQHNDIEEDNKDKEDN